MGQPGANPSCGQEPHSSAEPSAEGINALPCIVCGCELRGCSLPNQPLDGLSFHTPGAYGTTLFDPMDGSMLEVNICDPCLVAASQRGRVLHYGAGLGSKVQLWSADDTEAATPVSADPGCPQ